MKMEKKIDYDFFSSKLVFFLKLWSYFTKVSSITNIKTLIRIKSTFIITSAEYGHIWKKKNPSEKETFITQFCSKFMIKSRLIFLWGLFHFSNFQLNIKRHSSANKISRLLFLTVNWSILIINQSMKSFWYCKTFDLTKKKSCFETKNTNLCT